MTQSACMDRRVALVACPPVLCEIPATGGQATSATRRGPTHQLRVEGPLRDSGSTPRAVHDATDDSGWVLAGLIATVSIHTPLPTLRGAGSGG